MMSDPGGRHVEVHYLDRMVEPEGAQLLVCLMKGILNENLSAVPRTWGPRVPVTRVRPFVCANIKPLGPVTPHAKSRTS